MMAHESYLSLRFLVRSIFFRGGFSIEQSALKERRMPSSSSSNSSTPLAPCPMKVADGCCNTDTVGGQIRFSTGEAQIRETDLQSLTTIGGTIFGQSRSYGNQTVAVYNGVVGCNWFAGSLPFIISSGHNVVLLKFINGNPLQPRTLDSFHAPLQMRFCKRQLLSQFRNNYPRPVNDVEYWYDWIGKKFESFLFPILAKR
jgi:hypothetical protein